MGIGPKPFWRRAITDGNTNDHCTKLHEPSKIFEGCLHAIETTRSPDAPGSSPEAARAPDRALVATGTRHKGSCITALLCTAERFSQHTRTYSHAERHTRRRTHAEAGARDPDPDPSPDRDQHETESPTRTIHPPWVRQHPDALPPCQRTTVPSQTPPPQTNQRPIQPPSQHYRSVRRIT